MASPENYTLGKGRFYYAPYSEETEVTEADYIELGNCPQFNVSVSQEKLEHFSSRGGINKKDKEVTTQIGYTLTPTTDEITPEALVMFFGGKLMPNGEIYGLTDTEREYACKYVSDNPAGPNRVSYFRRVKFTGSGDVAFIGTEWMQLPLTGEGLADDVWNPQSPFFTFMPGTGMIAQILTWTTGANYNAGDFVNNGGDIYTCTTAHTAGATFDPASFTAVDPWQANAAVLKDDYVVEDGKVYQAAVDFTSGAVFADDDGYWTLVAA